MQGTVHIIPADLAAAHLFKILTVPPTLDELREIVGGPLEVVPGFSTVMKRGEPRPCLVFCIEEGKLHGLPANGRGSLLWENSLRRDHGIPENNDALVGDVAILMGDEEFMDALSGTA